LNNEEKNTFSLFQNSTSGITILYPSNWTNLERSGNVSFAVSSPQGSHFSIIVDKLFGDTLEDHSGKYIQSKNNSLSHFLDVFPTPFEVIKMDKNYVLSGSPAHKLIYKYPCFPDLATCTVLDIWTINNDKVFHVIYQTPVTLDLESDISLPIVEKMIKSFKIDLEK